MLDAVAEDALGTQFMRGVNALRKTRYTTAVQHLLNVVVADPQCAPAHAYLGVVYFYLHDIERAKWHLALAVELDPAEFLAWAEPGALHL